ncbi:type I CRISPR-associated protein Cas8a1/Csx8 [Anaerosporobacter sp.]|uniref:type I CRISPR-associated protein Cas8a1/Csx8 n=1 Tax=Anaerosporobacter sp. TaxID=1872529 RepID=UPI00286F4F61|nr:type I CRISPR-associated protein Cas8a1/Csx8 [Anaerosporobacter sp.]
MGEQYDTKLEGIDWRYCAAMVGLKLYFDFSNQEYDRITDYEQGQDYLVYNKSVITKERYLAFAEDYFREDMFHTGIEDILYGKSEFSEAQIDMVNAKLTGNTVMKKVFGKMKFDGTNYDAILTLINSNRTQIITETFKNKKNLYANYCNTNLFQEEMSQPHCRLVGYNLDEGRKSRSAAYNFNADSFISADCIEFDFIPFSFSNTFEALFINNNWSFLELCKTNKTFANLVQEEKKEYQVNARNLLFRTIIEASDFLDYDIEVIIKNRDKEYYETLFIRKKAITILKSLKSINALLKPLKLNDNYYINIQEEAVGCIINEVLTDRLIELLLKEETIRHYAIDKLIEINYKIKGLVEEKGEIVMKAKIYSTKKCAEEVVRKIEKNKANKVKAYRQKLTSAIVAGDYDRFCEILLQLSSYSEVSFPFSYDLFEDFEKNKELAYTFVAALDPNAPKIGEGQEETKNKETENN